MYIVFLYVHVCLFDNVAIYVDNIFGSQVNQIQQWKGWCQGQGVSAFNGCCNITVAVLPLLSLLSHLQYLLTHPYTRMLFLCPT